MAVAAGIGLGLGSMPGVSSTEALTIIAGETPELLHIPELPTRGPGGDMIGRSYAALNSIDRTFAVDLQPAGWQASRGEPLELRRGKAWLAEDLEALQTLVAGSTGAVKLQLAGPFTLAAAVSPVSGDRLLTDRGALSDLVQGLIAAASDQLQHLRRHAPAAQFIVQMDEPSLAAAISGKVKTRTGRGSLPPVELPFARDLLRRLADGIRGIGAEPWLHCCANEPPLSVLAGLGFAGWSLPLAGLAAADPNLLITHLDATGLLVLGVRKPAFDSVANTRRAVGEFAGRIGIPQLELARYLSVSHECGLAFSPNPARDLAFVAQVGRALSDEE